MKKIFVILLAIAMLLSMAACGGKEPAPTEAPAVTEPEIELPNYEFTQYGNARITIVGAEFFKDEDDADMLRVYFDYTNTGDTAIGQSPMHLEVLKITQNGQELENRNYGSHNDAHVPEDLTDDTVMQPGKTVRSTMLICCSPENGIVEISCYVMIGSWVFSEEDVEAFTFQIDPNDLMGAPAKALEYEPVTNPTYTVGMPSSGSTDYPHPCEVSINGFEVITTSDGEPALRAKLAITNQGEEYIAPYQMVTVEAFQDGVSLEWLTYNWDLDDYTAEDEAFAVELEPGETADYNALFLLRSENPVEVVVEQQNDEMRLGMVCDIEEAIQAQKNAEQAANDAAEKAEAEARKQIVGTWLQRDSDWDDTYIFNADGSGLLISGPEYPFTYEIEDDILRVDYGDDDVEDFTFSVSGDLLTLIDMWGDELLLDKQAAEAETEVAQTEAPAAEKSGYPYEKEILGTWLDEESGYLETFTFNADGTGVYSYTDEGEVYEFPITYRFLRSDYLEFFYEDGSEGGFVLRIEGNILYVTNTTVVDMPLVRQ